MRPSLIILFAALVFSACSGKTEELHVFNWDDYFAPDTLSTFEEEVGCRVTYDKYASDQDLMAKLLAGGSGYDVCFPSDEMVPALIEKGLLEPLDLTKLNNWGNVAPDRLGLGFDKDNRYTLPYLWGTTGIAYNLDKVTPPPSSWKDLWNAAWRGRVSILDDAREALGAALRAIGKSVNESDVGLLQAAREKLVELKPRLLGFDSAPKEKLIAGDVWIAQCFSGDAIQARNAGARIGYVIPAEGGTLWIDNMAIPKGASNPDLAHRFIDYLLRAEVSARIAGAVGYASANAASREFTNQEVLEDPIAYPPPEELRRCEVLRPLAAELKVRIEDLWAEVKLH
jgi:spermidine/putrescine-binding protein